MSSGANEFGTPFDQTEFPMRSTTEKVNTTRTLRAATVLYHMAHGDRWEPTIETLAAWASVIERESSCVELLTALEDLHNAIHEYGLLDVKKRFRLCMADAQAGTAIRRAKGE